MTAAGTAGGCGTLTWLFSDVKAIAVGDAVLVLLLEGEDAPRRGCSRLSQL